MLISELCKFGSNVNGYFYRYLDRNFGNLVNKLIDKRRMLNTYSLSSIVRFMTFENFFICVPCALYHIS